MSSYRILQALGLLFSFRTVRVLVLVSLTGCAGSQKDSGDIHMERDQGLNAPSDLVREIVFGDAMNEHPDPFLSILARRKAGNLTTYTLAPALSGGDQHFSEMTPNNSFESVTQLASFLFENSLDQSTYSSLFIIGSEDAAIRRSEGELYPLSEREIEELIRALEDFNWDDRVLRVCVDMTP